MGVPSVQIYTLVPWCVLYWLWMPLSFMSVSSILVCVWCRHIYFRIEQQQKSLFHSFTLVSKMTTTTHRHTQGISLRLLTCCVYFLERFPFIFGPILLIVLWDVCLRAICVQPLTMCIVFLCLSLFLGWALGVSVLFVLCIVCSSVYNICVFWFIWLF